MALGPLFFFFIIRNSELIRALYNKTIDFINGKYTFVYIVSALMVLVIPYLGIDPKLLASLFMVLKRFLHLMLVYDAQTIYLLHSFLCCGAAPATTPLARGAAVVITGVVLGKTELGQFAMGVIDNGLNEQLNQYRASKAFQANDRVYAKGGQSKAQYELTNQALMNKYHVDGTLQKVTKVYKSSHVQSKSE